MYKKIIVGLALDHGISETALAKANLLLDEGGEIIALHVYETPGGTVSAYVSETDMARGREHAKTRLADALNVDEIKLKD